MKAIINKIDDERVSKKGNRWGTATLLVDDEPRRVVLMGDCWQLLKAKGSSGAECEVTLREEKSEDPATGQQVNRYIVGSLTIGEDTAPVRPARAASGRSAASKPDRAAMLTSYKKDVFIALLAQYAGRDLMAARDLADLAVNEWYASSRQAVEGE